MKSIVKTFIILLFIVCFFSCSSRTKLINLELKDDQTIVAGKLDIYYNGNDVTEETVILFNEISWGTYSYIADSSHMILTYLPAGESYIARIAYKNFFVNLNKEQSLFNIKNINEINYIGHITIDWRGDEYKMPNMFGLVGAIADEIDPDGSVRIFVGSTKEEIEKYLKNKYENEINIQSNLINAISFNDSIESTIKDVHEKKDSGYYTFNIADSTSRTGKIFKLSDKEIFVKNKRNVYIIDKKKLLSITKSGINVTEESMKNYKEMNLSLFKYRVERIE